MPAKTRARKETGALDLFPNPSNPANPEIFGEDIVQMAWIGLGLAGTEFLDQKLARPLVGGILPLQGDTGAKAVDALTTYLSAWVAGEVVGFIDRGVGRRVRMGGLVLGTGKLASIFLPGFSITASLPSGFNIPLPMLQTGSSAPALPAASAANPVMSDVSRTTYQTGL